MIQITHTAVCDKCAEEISSVTYNLPAGVRALEASRSREILGLDLCDTCAAPIYEIVSKLFPEHATSQVDSRLN